MWGYLCIPHCQTVVRILNRSNIKAEIGVSILSCPSRQSFGMIITVREVEGYDQATEYLRPDRVLESHALPAL